jgi:hypothetical protein
MAAQDEKSHRTGEVELLARLDWLKDGQIGSARMAPQEARTLARWLLEAADIAEFGS